MGGFPILPPPTCNPRTAQIRSTISIWIAPHRDKHLQNSSVIWTCMVLECQKMSCVQAGTAFLFPSFHHAIYQPHSCAHEHHTSRSSETSGGSGHRFWAKWNPERVKQFCKSPSQTTMILKNLSKSQLLGRGGEGHIVQLPSSCHGEAQIIFSFSTTSATFRWSQNGRKWSFIQNSWNFKPSASQSNVCPAIYWQKAAGLGINQINVGWRKNILPSPRTPCLKGFRVEGWTHPQAAKLGQLQRYPPHPQPPALLGTDSVSHAAAVQETKGSLGISSFPS